jgi:hypothetical protein
MHLRSTASARRRVAGRRGAGTAGRNRLRRFAHARLLTESCHQPVSSLPLIEPNVRISRIRLTDRVQARACSRTRLCSSKERRTLSSSSGPSACLTEATLISRWRIAPRSSFAGETSTGRMRDRRRPHRATKHTSLLVFYHCSGTPRRELARANLPSSRQPQHVRQRTVQRLRPPRQFTAGAPIWHREELRELASSRTCQVREPRSQASLVEGRKPRVSRWNAIFRMDSAAKE